MMSEKAPHQIKDRIKGKVVPSTVQLYGETFHREANVDADFKELWEDLTRFRADNDRLRKALEFYAWLGGYVSLHGGRCAVLEDRGDKARATLAKEPQS